ncbi:MAG: ABC transporter substrate-binding protein [Alphaproteobacteria bacterium]|nr:ABC transporter substrate-binding protein [Alphaproteobacteria bacterium]
MQAIMLSRRLLLAGSAATGALAAAGPALAQGRKSVLVIGMDISDGRNYDPGRMADYSPPLTNGNVYETLVTQEAGDYVNVRPMLATKWERVNGGKSWRFTLRQGVKFWDGSPFTAEDVKFSLDRLVNLKDQPGVYASNLEKVEIVDAHTVDLVMKDPASPLLINCAAPAFAIYSKKIVSANGGVSDASANTADKATQFLNSNSAGTAAYRMVSWERNTAVTLVRNDHWWGGKAPFERVVIRHIADGAAQLLAVRRGDIDAAFNLTAEQLDSVKGDANVRLESTTSLDYVYMTLTSNAEFNPALAKREARQAVAYAIDYDGIISGLVGGFAVRPPSFLPIGAGGTTAEMTKEFGYRQDLDKAKSFLQQAGLPNGFEFDLSITNAAIVGSNYQVIAQKVQSDLARVGIKANLKPLDPVNLRTQYNGGRTQSVITFWNPPSPETDLWASASIERVAKRVHWDVPQSLRDLVKAAGAEQDQAKQIQLYKQYQQALVDNANYIILLQPIYRIAVRNTIKNFNVTAAGWYVEMERIEPA